MRHLDEAERILSPFEAERWNPWNLTLVAQTLGRVRTERALLALSHSVRDAEASFLSARATYHQSLRHEPAQQNTHSSASMKVYRTSRGERGRLPLASCGLVTDDVGVLLARGRHEVCHARFAMPRNAAYASVLLAQAGVMFGMAAGLDPRSPAPVAGAAAVLAENALLLSGNDNNEVKMTKGAENMFAAVTDVAGVFGPPSYDEGTCAQVYLDYAAFLVFSAVSATAVKEDEEDSKKKMRQKLVDGLTAALMAMNMGNGYEPAPVFMAAYAAFLLDKVDLCAALISRFNSIVECEDGSRPLSPEVFSTAARDSFDMNEFFWRLSL